MVLRGTNTAQNQPEQKLILKDIKPEGRPVITPNAELNDDAAKTIRFLYDNGQSLEALSDLFHVHESIVEYVLRGVKFPDAGGPELPRDRALLSTEEIEMGMAAIWSTKELADHLNVSLSVVENYLDQKKREENPW